MILILGIKVTACSFCFSVFSSIYFIIFCLLKFGSLVLLNQQYFGQAQDQAVVGCAMSHLFEFRFAFVFPFIGFHSVSWTFLHMFV